MTTPSEKAAHTHSELPWTLHEVLPAQPDCTGVLNIRSGDENILAICHRIKTSDEANFRLIVRAVNNHASLVNALTETTEGLEDLIEAMEGIIGLDSFQQDTLANCRVILGAVARKALAKATT